MWMNGIPSLTLAAALAVAPWLTSSAAVPPYRPLGADTGVRGRATGFFRVERMADGRWWAVDPLGRGVVLLGVDHVTYRGHWCEKTRSFPHLAEMKRKFPDEEDWRRDTLARLADWGFNALGAGSSAELRHRGMVHTEFLSMGDEWAGSGKEELWICPNEGRPCSAFPNVFHPDWPRHCDEVAARKCAPNRDDPWLFGYFIDNELAWWGRSPQWGVSGTGLFDEAVRRPAGHAAREAALAMAVKAGVRPGGAVPDKVKLAFLRRAAELYFSAAAAAIRRHDPNHLVMGARIAGVSGANRVVWEESGRHCDVVTFNCYPWADIDRNVVLNDAWSRKEPVAEAFARLHEWTGRPLLVTEWSFPALDSGLPCTQGAGQRFRTQAERAAASGLFARTVLSMPFMVGYDYFMWVDEPALGISTAFPENSNYGLVDERGAAYRELTETFREIHRDAGRLRSSPPPERSEVRPARHDAAAAWSAACAPEPAPRFRLEDGRYRLENAAGLVLEGRVDGPDVFTRVAVGDVGFGRFSFMVSHQGEGRVCWSDVRRVERVERTPDGVLVAAYGESDGRGFRVELEVRVHPRRPEFLVDLRRLVNAGAKPLEVRKVLFREYADFMDESLPAEEVPTLWKAPKRAVWIASDGRYYGACSRSDCTNGFSYWKGEYGAHPDAVFDVPPSGDGGAMALAPGAEWTPGGEVYVVACVGFGGRGRWRAAAALASGDGVPYAVPDGSRGGAGSADR